MDKSEEILGDKFSINKNDRSKNSVAIILFRKRKEDMAEIESFLDDLGKYEKIVNGIGYMIDSLGLNSNGIEFCEITEDDITYEGKYDEREGSPVFYIRIDEKKRETEERREFAEEELRNLIGNVDKYHALKESFKLLKEILNQ